MIPEVNLLLVFCEGPNDTAFVRMVMNKLIGFNRMEQLKFSEMPAPFNSLFKNAVKKYTAQDMSLNMVHKFFLPDTVLRKGNTI